MSHPKKACSITNFVAPSIPHWKPWETIMDGSLFEAYEELTAEGKRDLKGAKVSAALERVIRLSLAFLSRRCKRLELTSSVPNKEYFAFQLKGERGMFSRPVNSQLFDPVATRKLISRLVAADLTNIDETTRARILYSSAISYCCTTDLIRRDDRKTPATFFENLVGHLVSRTFNVNPERQIRVLALAPGTTLPTDFVFDLGRDKGRLHLPVKISTRERIIQVWAHQRVLDGVYGINRFKGILICLTETNMVRKNMSVVEVCLPDQWAIYQMFISQLHRIYYLDPPVAYAPLARRYPFIQVKSFSNFFDEAHELATGS